MYRRSVPLLLLALVGVALLPGCGDPRATVSGTVTLDGQPVEDGAIVISSVADKGHSSQAEIRQGKYQVKTVPGPAEVRISWLKVVGQRKDSDAPNAILVDIREEQVPARYNGATTELKFEVQKGANTKDWQLESK